MLICNFTLVRTVDKILTDTQSKRCAKQRIRSYPCLRKLLPPRELLGFQDRCNRPLCHPSDRATPTMPQQRD